MGSGLAIQKIAREPQYCRNARPDAIGLEKVRKVRKACSGTVDLNNLDTLHGYPKPYAAHLGRRLTVDLVIVYPIIRSVWGSRIGSPCEKHIVSGNWFCFKQISASELMVCRTMVPSFNRTSNIALLSDSETAADSGGVAQADARRIRANKTMFAERMYLPQSHGYQLRRRRSMRPRGLERYRLDQHTRKTL